jgi:hypothetical protein
MALRFVTGYEPPSGTLDDPFAAIWDHYLRAKFIYTAKLERLERALPSIRAGWPQLLTAPADVFHTHAAWEDGQMVSSIAAFRDTDGTYVIEHAASAGRANLMMACVLSCLATIDADPQFHHARMYFRPENRWPARAAQAIADAIGPFHATFDERAFLVCDPARRAGCVSKPNGDLTVVDLTPDRYGEALALLIETMGASHASALGFTPEALASGTLDPTLIGLNARYLSAGLRRTRRLLAIYQDGVLAGLALCHTASVVMNFSYLCSRTELVAHPQAPNRAQMITRLAEAALAEARARGDPYTALLVRADDAPAACAAGYTDTHHPYAALTWAREDASGAPSASRGVESLYGRALGRLRQRFDTGRSERSDQRYAQEEGASDLAPMTGVST